VLELLIVVALQTELVEDVVALELGLVERMGWLAFAILFGKAVETNQGYDRQEGGMGRGDVSSGDVSKPI
jgi:hypothetical protein